MASLADLVIESAAAAGLNERDAAAAALAVAYARLIDEAAPAAKYAKALDWLATVDSEDPHAGEHERTIRTALAAHTVASDLGPKLLAALEALRLSPRARAAGTGGGAANGGQPSAPANPLDQLAAARARKGRPETVDTAAP